jgi:hypothetical protein
LESAAQCINRSNSSLIAVQAMDARITEHASRIEATYDKVQVGSKQSRTAACFCDCKLTKNLRMQKMEPIAVELPRIVSRMRTLEALHREAALFR